MLSTGYLSSAAHVRSGLARRVTIAAALTTTALVAACSSSSDSPTSPTKPVPGAYPMATARGMTVPHTFTDANGSKLTIQGGALTMTANGAYSLNYKGKLNALTFDLTDEGTFSQSGSIVTFKPDDGDPSYTGRMVGGSIVVDAFKIAGAMFELGFRK
jgi:hypothetical protein